MLVFVAEALFVCAPDVEKGGHVSRWDINGFNFINAKTRIKKACFFGAKVGGVPATFRVPFTNS